MHSKAPAPLELYDQRTRKGRIPSFCVLSWFPLLILSWIQGVALQGHVSLSFLSDFSAHVRFLVCLPALMALNRPVGTRLTRALEYLRDSEIVPAPHHADLNHSVGRARKFLDAPVTAAILIAIVFLFVLVKFHTGFPQGLSSWHHLPTGENTYAFMWFSFVSIPIYQFFLFRWALRLLAWIWLLWKISTLNLQLSPMHPDGVGGLQFLTWSQYSFVVIGLVASVAQAAVLNELVNDGILTLSSLEAPTFTTFLLAASVFLGPLLIFTPLLMKSRWRGRFEYDALAFRVAREHYEKWIAGPTSSKMNLEQGGDFSTLIDMQSSVNQARKMKISLIDAAGIIVVAVAVLLPRLPLLLHTIPLGVLIRQAVKFIAK